MRLSQLEEGAIAGHLRTLRGWMESGKSKEECLDLAKKRGMHPSFVHNAFKKKDEVK